MNSQWGKAETTLVSLTDEQKRRVRALVQALRSGSFKQGNQRLARLVERHFTWEYCCLGVACEVAMMLRAPLRLNAEPGISYDIKRYTWLASAGDDCNSSTTSLPGKLDEWFGFHKSCGCKNGCSTGSPNLSIPPALVGRKNDNGTTLEPGRHYSAITLNDSYRLSLAAIADCFEYTFLREDWDERQKHLGCCVHCAEGSWHVVCQRQDVEDAAHAD